MIRFCVFIMTAITVRQRGMCNKVVRITGPVVRIAPLLLKGSANIDLTTSSCSQRETATPQHERGHIPNIQPAPAHTRISQNPPAHARSCALHSVTCVARGCRCHAQRASARILTTPIISDTNRSERARAVHWRSASAVFRSAHSIPPRAAGLVTKGQNALTNDNTHA